MFLWFNINCCYLQCDYPTKLVLFAKNVSIVVYCLVVLLVVTSCLVQATLFYVINMCLCDKYA
jgi:hypothetical protein